MLGWLFIGLDKRAQQYEHDHDDVAAFESEVSPVDALVTVPEAESVEPPGAASSDDWKQWEPKTATGSTQGQLASALESLRRPGKRSEAMKALEQLASQGYYDAMLEIGRAFNDPKYSTYAPSKAYAWLTVAQAFGSAGAEELRSGIAERMAADDLQDAHMQAGKLLANLKKRIEKNG